MKPIQPSARLQHLAGAGVFVARGTIDDEDAWDRFGIVMMALRGKDRVGQLIN